MPETTWTWQWPNCWPLPITHKLRAGAAGSLGSMLMSRQIGAGASGAVLGICGALLVTRYVRPRGLSEKEHALIRKTPRFDRLRHAHFRLGCSGDRQLGAYIRLIRRRRSPMVVTEKPRIWERSRCRTFAMAIGDCFEHGLPYGQCHDRSLPGPAPRQCAHPRGKRIARAR